MVGVLAVSVNVENSGHKHAHPQQLHNVVAQRLLHHKIAAGLPRSMAHVRLGVIAVPRPAALPEASLVQHPHPLNAAERQHQHQRAVRVQLAPAPRLVPMALALAQAAHFRGILAKAMLA